MTKVCPVHIEIEYTSGRTEKKTITAKATWVKWERDLKLGVEFGAIKHYTTETEQDRQNKKMGTI